MRIGIFGGDTGGRTIDDVVADARAAEQDGFASYALPQIFGLDAMGVLAIVGREVPRIELATGVVPTYGRHPVTMAQQALTVQAASGGRFTLGIGLSHQIVIENMFGLSFDKPLRHMREYLAVLMPLLHDGKADVDGETISTHVGLAVAERSDIPVLIAALGPKMLELAGTVTDGTVTWMTGPRPSPPTSCPRSPPRPSAPGGRRRRSWRASRSVSPPTSTPRASAPPRTSRSTASCPRTARCSTGKAPPARRRRDRRRRGDRHQGARPARRRRRDRVRRVDLRLAFRARGRALLKSML